MKTAENNVCTDTVRFESFELTLDDANPLSFVTFFVSNDYLKIKKSGCHIK